MSLRSTSTWDAPKKFSTAGGMGAALLDDPQRAADIVRSIRSALPSHISVSAKIRLLKDTPSTIDFVRTLVSAGASSITVHARTVGMKEQDEALLERLRPVIDSVKQYGGVEAVVNGDLYNREDMARVVEMSGADSVMVARPALYNTSIFRCKEDGGMLSKQEVIKEYVEECVRWQAHHKNAKYVIAEMMTNRRAPKSLLRSLPHNYPGNQTISKVCACHSISDLCKLWNVQMSMERWTKLLDIKPQTTTEHKYEDAYLLRLEKNDFGSSNRIQAEAILSKRPRIKDKEDEQKCK